MATYLIEVQDAIDALIPTIWAERARLDDLQAQRDRLAAQVQQEYSSAHWGAMNAEDADDVMLATAKQWGTYFGPDKELHGLRSEVDELQAALDVRKFSVQALSGALLQIAKQGLSIVHGQKPSNLGRLVGSQHLSEVVWQARNQAIHWEDGTLRNPVTQCFAALHLDFGDAFDDLSSGSLAFEVLNVLGWRTVADFCTDMQTLA